MKKIKCIIVDDEPLAIDVIKNHLEHFYDIEIVAECSNAHEAGIFLRNNKIDLIFLDIEMPKISGFDFLASLKNHPKIIIVTAYRNYALKGYEYDIVDYLLKPVSFKRFYLAINKFYKQNKINKIEIKNDKKNNNITNDFIYVNEDKTIHKFFLKDITYIESYKEYVKIHSNKKSILTKLSIGKIDQKLKKKGFVRIHKSFIASISKINSFNARTVTINEQKIPIGRTYKKSVMDILKFDSDLL